MSNIRYSIRIYGTMYNVHAFIMILYNLKYTVHCKCTMYACLNISILKGIPFY